MSFFEHFFAEKKKPADKVSPVTDVKPHNYSSESELNVLSSNALRVFIPKSYDDVSEIIDMLSVGKPAIVNLTDLKPVTAQRVMDLLSGAIYALHGGLCEISKLIYIFTPDGVTVKT